MLPSRTVSVVPHSLFRLFAHCCRGALYAGIMLSPLAMARELPVKSKLMMADILKASAAADWRSLNPDNTLYLELPKGRVVIELAPDFAPGNVANIKALVRENYFDGLAIVRSQENYVVQWADPDEKREIKTAKKTDRR